MHRAVVSKEIPGAREDVRGLDPGHRRSFMTVFVGFNRKTLDQDLTAGEVGKSGKRISSYGTLAWCRVGILDYRRSRLPRKSSCTCKAASY